MRDPDLAARLAAFSIDEGAPTLTFTARLARENRWSLPRAGRVVEEYLRFIYLASVSSETVTPSVAVDQAWHLHLCYTRSYWHRLCRDLLGRELHHGPTRGGSAENLRYRECYERTLRLYMEEFGAAPPADIWPSAKLRFSPGASSIAVTPSEHLIVSKAALRRAFALLAIAPATALGLGALTRAYDATFAFGFLFCGLVLFGLWLLFRVLRHASRGKRHTSDNGCAVSSCGTSSSSSCGASSSNDGHSHHSGDSGHSSADSGGGDSGGHSGCGSGCGGGGCGGGGGD